MSKHNQRNQNSYYDQRKDRGNQDYRHTKEIRPIIEDDRKMSKPTYTSKEHQRDQGYKQRRQDTTHDRTQDYNKSYDKRDNRRDNRRNQPQQRYYERPRGQSNIQPHQNTNQSHQRRGHDKNYRQQFEKENYNIKKIFPESQNIQNYVYVGKKSNLNQLYDQVKSKLPKYNFVGIKATGSQVVKAFQLAENLSKDLSNLKRINIPGTVEIETIYTPKSNKKGLKEFTKVTKKASILIEVSFKSLSIRHMGYQQSSKKQAQNHNYNRAQNQRKRQQQKKIQKQDTKPEITKRYESKQKEVRQPNRQKQQRRDLSRQDDRENRRDERIKSQYQDNRDRIYNGRYQEKEVRRQERKADRQFRRQQQREGKISYKPKQEEKYRDNGERSQYKEKRQNRDDKGKQNPRDNKDYKDYKDYKDNRNYQDNRDYNDRSRR